MIVRKKLLRIAQTQIVKETRASVRNTTYVILACFFLRCLLFTVTSFDKYAFASIAWLDVIMYPWFFYVLPEVPVSFAVLYLMEIRPGYRKRGPRRSRRDADGRLADGDENKDTDDLRYTGLLGELERLQNKGEAIESWGGVEIDKTGGQGVMDPLLMVVSDSSSSYGAAREFKAGERYVPNNYRGSLTEYFNAHPHLQQQQGPQQPPQGRERQHHQQPKEPPRQHQPQRSSQSQMQPTKQSIDLEQSAFYYHHVLNCYSRQQASDPMMLQAHHKVVPSDPESPGSDSAQGTSMRRVAREVNMG